MYLEFAHIKVECDHMALKFLMGIKNPRGRLARWQMDLLQQKMTIEYRRGLVNHVADFLSRYLWPEEDQTRAQVLINGQDNESDSEEFTGNKPDDLIWDGPPIRVYTRDYPDSEMLTIVNIRLE